MTLLQRERWRVLEPLLDEALKLDDSERASWLGDLRSRAPDLADDLTSLLSGEAVADRNGFLAEPIVATLEGLELGAYTLEHSLGQGGMGSVWLARRTDGRFEGRAAVKLLNLALLTAAGEEQFRQEGSALARLTHPGIARLLDAGVGPGGQPYLVLEHIDGRPIDDFADERGLSLPDRLALFLRVLDAVGHAHANLVVHRDLKPSNILVTSDGAVKLLDFGLAKLLQADVAPAGPATTRTGHRWMTPEYASPEQVRGEPVTTRTDVYQLGVVLYELLAGRVPFVRGNLHDLETAALTEEPPPPSLVAGENARAAHRELRGDLDAIVLKALSKTPTERYASVEALGDDLRRYLSGHPVVARRQTAGYRARRYVRRHRAGLGVAAVIALLALVYVITLSSDRQRIQRALAEARLGARRAEHVTDFMLGLFDASVGGKTLADSVTARELLSRGVERARELTGQPELQAQMLDVIGRIETQLGMYDRATPLLEEALATRRALYGERHADVATSLESLAEAAELKQDVAAMVRLRREALTLRRELSGADDPRSVDAVYGLAVALHTAGDAAAAKPFFDEWMAIIVRQPREVSLERAQELQTAGLLLTYDSQFDRAEPMLREALSIKRALFGDQHPRVGYALGALGELLDQARRPAEADSIAQLQIRIFRQAYPDGHPELARALRQWAVVLEHLHRYDEAQAPLRECLDMQRRLQGPNNIDVAMTELNLAFATTMTDGYREGEALSRDAMNTLRQLLGADNSMVYFAMIPLGDAVRGQGRFAEAESLLLKAYARFEKPKPITQQWHNSALVALVRLYDAQGKADQAAKYRALIPR